MDTLEIRKGGIYKRNEGGVTEEQKMWDGCYFKALKLKDGWWWCSKSDYIEQALENNHSRTSFKPDGCFGGGPTNKECDDLNLSKDYSVWDKVSKEDKSIWEL